MADERIPRVGAGASPIRQLEELSADLDALHSTAWDFTLPTESVARKSLQERRDELFKQWREHFAAHERWLARAAAEPEADMLCWRPLSHAPDCECATL